MRAEILQLCRQYGLSRAYLFKILHMLRSLFVPQRRQTFLSIPSANLGTPDSPRTNLSTPDSPRTNLSALDSPRTNLSALDSAGADILVSVDDIDSFCFSLKRLCVCLLDVIVNQRLLSLLMDLIPLNLQLVDLKSLCPIILRARSLCKDETVILFVNDPIKDIRILYMRLFFSCFLLFLSFSLLL